MNLNARTCHGAGRLGSSTFWIVILKVCGAEEQGKRPRGALQRLFRESHQVQVQDGWTSAALFCSSAFTALLRCQDAA